MENQLLPGQAKNHASQILVRACATLQMPTKAHPLETQDRGTRCAQMARRSGLTPVSDAYSRGPPQSSLSPLAIKATDRL
jgi:hypothetical protein